MSEIDLVEEVRLRRQKLMKDKYYASVDNLVDEAIDWQKQNAEQVVNLRKHEKEDADTELDAA